MIPVSPVLPGQINQEVIFGAGQPEYRPLPAIVATDGVVLTRWRLTWAERLIVLWRGDVYLTQKTGGGSLQPVLIMVEKPQVEYAKHNA